MIKKNFSTFCGVLALLLAGLGPPIGLLTAPAPARATTCSQWGFNGDTDFQQSDGWVLNFNSTGPSAQGPAEALDGNFPDTGDPKHGNVTGGVVNGQGIDIQVHWDNGTYSKYSGEVDPNGGVSGNVYVPAQDPSVTGKAVASYTAAGLKCITLAASPAPAAPAPPLVPPLVIGASPAATSVQIKSGPATLQAGLSGTYVVTVANTFTREANPGSHHLRGQTRADRPDERPGRIELRGRQRRRHQRIGNLYGPNSAGELRHHGTRSGLDSWRRQFVAKLDNDTKQQTVTIT